MTKTILRVPYADTDQMGMVYYANYLVYFERGRTEWLREHGLTYRSLEEQGFFFPVMEAACTYVSPARYDDQLTVTTVLSRLGPASIEFAYTVENEGKLLANGTTKHPLVNRSFKPLRMPQELRSVLEKAYAEKDRPGR